ncbi:hypothetical protein LCGC14_2226980, partial [marine sediment metagenome]
MNTNKLALALIISGLCTTGSVAAANDRYIIQVDNNKKGVVKALAKNLGGDIKVDGNGFIAAQFTGHDLASIKGLLNNPHIKLNEEDQKQIVKLWNLINTEYRKIGAAIVRDISKHINSGGTLGSSLMMYVFPQFEGLNDDKIKKFLVDIANIIDSTEELEEIKQ